MQFFVLHWGDWKKYVCMQTWITEIKFILWLVHVFNELISYSDRIESIEFRMKNSTCESLFLSFFYPFQHCQAQKIANGDDNGAIKCDHFKPLDGFIKRRFEIRRNRWNCPRWNILNVSDACLCRPSTFNLNMIIDFFILLNDSSVPALWHVEG